MGGLPSGGNFDLHNECLEMRDSEDDESHFLFDFTCVSLNYGNVFVSDLVIWPVLRHISKGL